MSFENYLSPARVIELRASQRDEAFAELVGAIARSAPEVDRDSALHAVRERELLTSTRIGASIAIPHARIEGLSGAVVAVGVSRAGVRYDEHGAERVHIIVMLLSDEASHLATLSSVVSRFASPAVRERVIRSDSAEAAYRIIVEASPALAIGDDDAESLTVLEGALTIARSVGARSLFVHTDRMLPRLEAIAATLPVVAFTTEPFEGTKGRVACLHFPFALGSTDGRIELSLLLARVAGHIAPGVRVVSLLASRNSGRFDRVAISDSSGRFGTELDGAIAGDGVIDHRVFARVLQLALALGVEGREGKPVGTIFVLGATDEVLAQCRQLIANPFKGYDDAEKNVLDPSMEESIKEYAKIDGAFIVRSDGVIVTAGAYIVSSNLSIALPRGLGSRHMAAASITATTDALAIALSESTGTVSLFRGGKRVAELGPSD